MVELDEVGDDESSIAEDSNVSVSSMGSRTSSAYRSPSPPTEKAKDEGAVEEPKQTSSEESADQPELGK